MIRVRLVAQALYEILVDVPTSTTVLAKSAELGLTDEERKVLDELLNTLGKNV
jgi:hypothetical protein